MDFISEESIKKEKYNVKIILNEEMKLDFNIPKEMSGEEFMGMFSNVEKIIKPLLKETFDFNAIGRAGRPQQRNYNYIDYDAVKDYMRKEGVHFKNAFEAIHGRIPGGDEYKKARESGLKIIGHKNYKRLDYGKVRDLMAKGLPPLEIAKSLNYNIKSVYNVMTKIRKENKAREHTEEVKQENNAENILESLEED